MKVRYYSCWGLAMLLVLATMLTGCYNRKVGIESQKLEDITQKIDSHFARIGQEVSFIAELTAELYQYKSDQPSANDKSEYSIAANGVMYKPNDDGLSAVYVSGIVPITDELKNIVYMTAPLDTTFQRIVKQFPEVAQVYYNNRYGYNRIYPFFDVLTQFEAKIDITKFNFYYLADLQHNPTKQVVWVQEPYIDPAGRGWIVSAIAPVYVDNVLEGVPGIDVEINTITDKYIKPSDDNVMIISQSGKLVTASSKLIDLFSMPTLGAHPYLDTIKSDSYQPESYNLRLNQDDKIRYLVSNILDRKMKKFKFQYADKKFVILSEEVSALHWWIIKVVEL